MRGSSDTGRTAKQLNGWRLVTDAQLPGLGEGPGDKNKEKVTGLTGKQRPAGKVIFAKQPEYTSIRGKILTPDKRFLFLNTSTTMPGKDYNSAMHTAEHILNSVMDKMYHCGRSFNSHIESRKSKCDYHIRKGLSYKEVRAVERTVNEIIKLSIPVGERMVSRREADEKYFTGKLPQDAGDTIRIITIGNFDACPCIGQHVSNTSEIGSFSITSADFNEGVLRIRFRLNQEVTEEDIRRPA